MPHEAARVRDPAANDFGQSLSLEIVIPQTPISELDKDAYTSVDPDNDHQDGSAMPGIAQRNLLFFDETLPVLILLRTSCLHEEELRAQLARITLALEAYVVNTPPRSVRNSGNGQLGTLPATRELICSRVIPHTEDPTVILRKGHNGGSEPDAEDVVFVVWQTDVRLRRPRLRAHNPVITFSVTANAKPVGQMTSPRDDEDYLPSLIPSAPNLLEAFRDDPALASSRPHLSASRISSVTSRPQASEEPRRPLLCSSQSSRRIVPALSARIRYATLSSSTDPGSVIVSLDMEATSLASCDINIEHVGLRLEEGSCEDLTAGLGTGYPLRCGVSDRLTLLYRLRPDAADELSGSHGTSQRDLEINVAVSAMISEKCQSGITMNWTASIDMSMRPVAAPKSSPTRTHHTTGSRESASSKHRPIGSDGASRLDAPLPERPAAVASFGVTATFTGPERVTVGESFAWSALLINQSNRVRRLVMTVLPHRTPQSLGQVRPGSSGTAAGDAMQDEIAKAVLDEKAVWEMTKSHVGRPAELIILSTDIPIGPLPPGACHSAVIRFLPIATGALQVESIRVTDVDSQEQVQVYDLPSIICQSTDV